MKLEWKIVIELEKKYFSVTSCIFILATKFKPIFSLMIKWMVL